MQPLGRRVVVERDPTLERYGRLIIPERARRTPQAGTVRAVGDLVQTLHPGDRVLFGKHAALDIDGVGAFLWEQDILAVLT